MAFRCTVTTFRATLILALILLAGCAEEQKIADQHNLSSNVAPFHLAPEGQRAIASDVAGAVSTLLSKD